MLDEITPEQFDEWVAFDRIEPVGEPRADFRAAQVAWVLARAWGSEATPEELYDLLDPDRLAAAAAGAADGPAADDGRTTVHNVALAFGARAA